LPADLLQQICAIHSGVITAENESTAEQVAERLRMVASLQQQASTVQTVVEERERAISQRKQIEEKLRRSEEFAKNIVESTVDCVKVLDLEGNIQYISPPGLRALEITDERQYLGRPWVTFWRDEDRKRAEDSIALARLGGVGSFQGDTLGPSGTRKSWDVKITPSLDTKGEIESLVVVSRDITELRNAQEIAIQAEKLAAAGRLAATIAHEINNPLEAITNFIYLAMTAKGLPEQVFQHLQIADRELARVAQIAQQTLGFYRDNSRARWIDVNELMQGVMVVYERKLERKHLQTEVSVSKGLNIYGKQGELRQALSNLIANAIDASKEGGKIWLRAHTTRHWVNGMEPGVRITLADNGSGMTPEVQRRIFVPFFTTKADIGTGIGLWATKSLIEKQGGYLRFRSKEGEKTGTVMSFFLPGGKSASTEKPNADA
jgi:PAS domain S-box-containing protein